MKNLNKILILGDGYMGNHIYKHLLDNEFDVIKKSSSDLNYHEERDLYKFILNDGITTIINCSGFTGSPNIDEAEFKKELCWKLNVDSPLKINKICDRLMVNYIHISSGCIYDGYEFEWTEEHPSNYGLFSSKSSFYSKTKHAFEHLSKDLKGIVLRIRMPFGPDSSHRNYLSKIRKYNNLINFKNSKTYIPDLCGVVVSILKQKGDTYWYNREIYNIVNPSPLWTNEVCEIMKDYGFHNELWSYVTLDSLDIVASRSNCVMDNTKASEIYTFKTEREALKECFDEMLENKQNYDASVEKINEKYSFK